mgnify:CR=1 FL=1
MFFHDLDSGEALLHSEAFRRIERHATWLDPEDADAYCWRLDWLLIGGGEGEEGEAEALLDFLDVAGAGLEWREAA